MRLSDRFKLFLLKPLAALASFFPKWILSFG